MSFDETSRRSVDEAQGTFGELLRRAREARGLALDAVAGATRIARRYLEALERGDLDSLPAGPFGKGYIRSYAKVLGIDPEPILRDYRDRERERGVGTADEERRTLEQLSRLIRSGESRKRPLRVPTRSVSLALALALVLALTLSLGILGMRGWILARSRVPEGPTPPSPATSVAGAEAAPPSRPPSSPPPTRAVAAPAPSTVPLQVSAHGVGTGLVDRRLVGRADRFPPGTGVSFWTLVAGGQAGHVIRHVWFHEGRAVMKTDLPIGGPHWRTHSRLLLPTNSAGRWMVEARTSDGRLLARDTFLCEATTVPAPYPRPVLREQGSGTAARTEGPDWAPGPRPRRVVPDLVAVPAL